MYRSDAPSSAAASHAESQQRAVESRIETPAAGAPSHLGRLETTAEGRPVVRPAEPAQPPPSPAKPTRGWIEIGVSVMVLPLTLTIMAMIAPVLWFAGSRPRR